MAHVADMAQAEDIATGLVARINKAWQERATITPRLTERKMASVIEIFKLLPGTNCRQCGYLTCIAYAAGLRKGAAELEQCKPLSEPGHSEGRNKLGALISPS